MSCEYCIYNELSGVFLWEFGAGNIQGICGITRDYIGIDEDTEDCPNKKDFNELKK